MKIAVFPPTVRERGEINAVVGIVTSVVILFCFAFIPTGAVVFTIKERETKFKHLQVISGMSHLAYWLANYCFDLMVFSFCAGAATFLVWLLGGATFGGDGLLPLIIVVTLYGFAIFPFSYMVSLVFSSHSTGQNVMILVNVMLSIVLLTVSTVLRVLSQTSADYRSFIRYIFRALPPFSLADVIYNLANRDMTPAGKDRVSVWDWQFSLYDFAFLAGASVVYSLLTLMFDSVLDPFCCSRCRVAETAEVTPSSHEQNGALSSSLSSRIQMDLDVDVAAEKRRLQALSQASEQSGWVGHRGSQDLIQIQGLRKVGLLLHFLPLGNTNSLIFHSHFFLVADL